jgi:hypothetical protein
MPLLWLSGGSMEEGNDKALRILRDRQSKKMINYKLKMRGK